MGFHTDNPQLQKDPRGEPRLFRALHPGLRSSSASPSPQFTPIPDSREMLVTCWAPNNHLKERLPGLQKGKKQHVPRCLESAGSRRDTHPKHPSAPVPMSVKDELQAELCPELAQPLANASAGHGKLGILRSNENT